MNVFVDTSALYATLDADDDMHHAAKTAWLELLAERAALHTTNYVLIEATALIQARLGMEAVRAFSADVLPVLKTFWVTEALHSSALQALLISDRRRLSLCDCVSFESMRVLGLQTAFCFDRHFADQGFAVVPSRGD